MPLLLLSLLLLLPAAARAGERRGPDLTITSVGVPPTITAGEVVTLRDATRNGGNRSARKTKTRFVLSADARRDAKDAALGTRTVKALKARKVARGSAQGRVPASAKPGGAYVIACADGGSAVKERSERNNCKAVAVTVRAIGSAPHGTGQPAAVPQAGPPASGGGENPGGEHPGGENPGGQVPDELPPPLVEPAKDPAAVAPPLDGTSNTTMAAGTSFLYGGDDPIQKGVEPGTIKPTRVAVLRGKVIDAAGKPLPAVKVTVLGHPEFGHTATRADGGYDIAVNGGDGITLEFERPGLIGIQRTVDAPWGDFADVPDVAMTPYDADVSTIDADSSAPIQVATGGPVTDGDGTRSATLMFEKGTDAVMTLPNGDTKPLDDLHVRATEYTVGPNGKKAMPGNLPDTSAYTYAVEFSIDEAEQARATEVKFSKPVPTYVDDFLGFPAGTKVPAAYYDDQKAHWVPSDDGLVIKILSIADGIASVDVDGDDQADGAAELAPLHLDEAELRQLAARYPAGKALWRVEVEHFSPWDYNWPYACEEFCEPPQQEEPPIQEAPECEAIGSIIGCLNQSLGESVAINGSDLDLAYSTVRMPGYREAYTVDIPLTGASLPAGVKRIEVSVSIAGREFTRSYDAAANLRHTFTWDGKDAYGRTAAGAQNATIKLGYVYGAVYMASREAQQRSFGQFGIAPLTRNIAREEITAWQTYTRPLGSSGTGSDALGGWTIAQHHSYDPIGRTLYLGDGTKRTVASVRAQVASWFGAGAGDDLGLARGIAAAPDGSVFVAESDRNRVRRIAPDGTARVVAGGGAPADGLGDGLAATAARLSSPSDVDLGPDGALYISDTGNGRVRRVGTDGRIATVAGGGDPDALGDDGSAREASLSGPRGIAVASDGTLYIADAGHDRVRRVTPDGHIATAAGGGDQGLGDGGSALAAELDLPTDVAIGAAGTLYIADSVHHRVRAVTATGVISTLAGDGVAGGLGDGGPAAEARLSDPQGVEVDSSGNVYIADRARHAIRRVSASGYITRYAGTGVSGSGPDGAAPARTALSFPQDVAALPNGSVAIADTANHRLRRIDPGLPGFIDADLAVPSGNGAEVYLFDAAGKHLRTVNALTKATIYEFGYDAAGRLKSITDRDGLTTRVDRDANGRPASIVAPNGRTTRLFLNDAGLLDTLEDPAQHATRLTYHDGGLLKSFTRPEGGRSTFEYDARGRLKRDVGPDGRSSTLTVAPQSVTVETTLGRKTVYRTETDPDGTRRRTVTEPGGAKTVSYTTEDGESVVVAPDGSKRTLLLGPDPRWGMAAPIAARDTTETPSGKRRVVRRTRAVELADPSDLLSVKKLTETVTVADGDAYAATITAPAAGGPDEWTAKATTPEGRETTRVFDSRGHVVRDQVKGRAAARYEYDDRGRFKTLKRGSGEAERTASLQFNDRDEVKSVTNQFGDVASFAYDDAGRPESRTAFDGASTTGYAHNADGLTTSVTPPGRGAFTRAIGADGLLHGSTAPAAGRQPNETTFEYDLDARIKTQDLPGPRAIGHTYDAESGHETAVTLERGTIGTDVEDATGRVMSITAPGGVKLDFGYDGGVALGWTWSGPVAGSVEREIDDELRTTRRTVNGADPVTFSYDDDGLLEHAGDETLGYDADNGALTSLTLGGLTETWTYDEFGAAKSMAAKRGAETVYALAFIRDKAGRITKRTETIGGETHVLEYTYDARGRLDTVKRDGAQIADPSYDANGNRTDGDTEHDAQDRITKRGAATYGYDAEGHRVSRTGPDGTTAYAYDELGNLLGVALPGGKHVEYVIDGQQRRIGKKVDGQLVQGLLWEGQLRPSAQLDAAGHVVSRFVYGGRDNVPDYMIRAGERYRLVADERGSVRLVVNVANGQVAQRLDYDEWGRVSADTNPGFQPFGYAGGLYDHETGLVRFGVRDYDAETGRWMSKDPSGFGAGDTNLYAYAADDPVNHADLNGLWTVITQTPFGIMDYFNQRTKELWPDTVDKDGNVTRNPDRWNGPGDAWRHCAGSCETARQYGETIAHILGDAHEIDGDIRNDQERGEKEMDLHNNACGREIGQRAESLTDCEQGCFNALRNGELKTYEQGTTPTFSEEVAKTMQDFAGFSGTGFNGFPRMGGMGF